MIPDHTTKRDKPNAAAFAGAMIRCSVVLMAMPVIMAERGVLELDNTTFGRVVGGSLPALVRFDTANSYGDAADAWQTMAVDIGKTDAAVLLCDVLLEESYAGRGRGRGSDYGHDEDEYPRDEEEEANRDGEEDEAGSDHPASAYDDDHDEYHDRHDHGYGDGGDDDDDGWRDNMDLLSRFGVSTDALPQFVFVPAGWTLAESPPPLYEGPHTYEALMDLVQKRAGVWVGLPGQEQWAHEAARRFVTSDAAGRMAEVEQAEARAGSDSVIGSYYVKVMKRALADDEFVAKETARLRKLIDESTLAEAKRAEFARRVNALASFQSSDAPASG